MKIIKKKKTFYGSKAGVQLEHTRTTILTVKILKHFWTWCRLVPEERDKEGWGRRPCIHKGSWEVQTGHMENLKDGALTVPGGSLAPQRWTFSHCRWRCRIVTGPWGSQPGSTAQVLGALGFPGTVLDCVPRSPAPMARESFLLCQQGDLWLSL